MKIAVKEVETRFIKEKIKVEELILKIIMV